MMMRADVNAIGNRMSLRAPQREGLAILDRITDLVPLTRGADLTAALDAIREEFPSVEEFERAFPSLCFALATGVGKTRLMGAFITYLHTVHGIDDFFVLAPNLTIYTKLIADFTVGTPKYVFKGISAFATNPPDVVTGDNYLSYASRLLDPFVKCRINVFNISKINSEVRGGRSPRIKRLSEYIGQSYFDWLAALPNLVLLMDESHRYRADAGVAAINELNPVLGLELTATPYVTRGTRQTPFQNVVQDYSLRRAMEDGFVKEPVVVTRANFDATGMSPEALELLKLEDGVRMHEQTKVELETYARSTGLPIVKPFVLVIARDTTHASALQDLVKSDGFFEGRYAGKVIQVDSSGSGVEKDETIEKLLSVERADSPVEIVIHVNMLKEGWDVTNLYTIVPLRTASARVLIEQTIGRGLRLPYGARTGVEEVDRLSIVAHDKFQEIVDESRKADSPIQMKTLVLSDDELRAKPRTVVAQSTLETRLGITPPNVTSSTEVPQTPSSPMFSIPAERAAAESVYRVIERFQREPDLVPDISYLDHSDIRERIVQEVQGTYAVGQQTIEGVLPVLDLESIVERVTSLVVNETISIPRIVVLPVGEVESGYAPFGLDLSVFRYPAVDETLWVQELRSGQGRAIGLSASGVREPRSEDYIISGLIDLDDISYDDHAPLLQELATQTVEHFRTYLDEDQTNRVLRVHQKQIANAIAAQMRPHYWTKASGFETTVSSGFTPIRGASYTHDGETRDFRQAPPDKSKYRSYLFGGYRRCLVTPVRFDSDAERVLSIILDRESLKWLKPASGQFQISYHFNGELPQYIPDFVAEFDDRIVMLEPKARNRMDDPEVMAKRDAAVVWCAQATAHSEIVGGKPWTYALIPHDVIQENQTAEYLVQLFAVVSAG